MHNLFSPWKLLDFESESKIFFVLNIVFFHSWSPYVASSSNSNFKKINVFKMTSLTCKQNQFLRRKVLKHSMNLIRFEWANFRPVAINTSVFNKISFFMQIFERLTFSMSMTNSPIVLNAIIKNLLPSKQLSRIFHHTASCHRTNLIYFHPCSHTSSATRSNSVPQIREAFCAQLTPAHDSYHNL